MAEEKSFFIMGCMGTRKVKIFIDETATLGEFSAKVEEVFSVSQNGQKMIFKGKLLSDQSSTLQLFGIERGDCVMVLGKVNYTERDTHLTELDKFKQKFHEEERAVAATVRDSKVVNDSQQRDSMKKLLDTNEKLMKLLESLDGMQIKQLSCEEVRSKRKYIVQGIQKLMDKVDREYSHLESQTDTS